MGEGGWRVEGGGLVLWGLEMWWMLIGTEG